jgi:hypothetical protein
LHHYKLLTKSNFSVNGRDDQVRLKNYQNRRPVPAFKIIFFWQLPGPNLKQAVNPIRRAIDLGPLPTECDSQCISLFREPIHLLILSRLLNIKRATRYFGFRMEHFYCTCHPATEPSKLIG